MVNYIAIVEVRTNKRLVQLVKSFKWEVGRKLLKDTNLPSSNFSFRNNMFNKR